MCIHTYIHTYHASCKLGRWAGCHLKQQTNVAKDLILILILILLLRSYSSSTYPELNPSICPSFQNQDPAEILAFSHPSIHPSPAIQPTSEPVSRFGSAHLHMPRPKHRRTTKVDEQTSSTRKGQNKQKRPTNYSAPLSHPIHPQPT
jgi:hypothetical protein